MRVLHVSQPVDAGVAAVALMLAADQRERGWDARIACPRGELVDRAVAASVPVRVWEATRGPGRSVPSEVRSLAAIVRAHAPDLVHLHSSKAGLAGRLAVRGRRPTIFQPHAWSFDAVEGGTATAARVWERVGARWAHRLLCVSEDELRLGRAAGVRTPARVVPNGVDTDRFAPRPATAARLALGLPDAPLVLCLGRLTEQKGQDLLLRAWPQVRERVPDAQLVVVGDGPRSDEWRAACTDPSVLWRGGTGDPAPWYAAADVVALPSRWEGMPLVALEALASGRPVAGFDVTGVREAVGEAGAVVAPGDTDALAEAIAARLHPGGPARAEGAAGRARVIDLFDRKRTADAVADVVEDLVRGSHRGER
ncbi:glycosyltransferase [Pseudonocardia endophytica]|uniref:Glycosyltransferase involved in cell wall biosynthesis n=1 Tax=Pseudonocardia endophytica TaxID=401976 RepID=A0A4R1HTY6_PSEEN|nr:glycosyltransferase [Pseudonocardia endophytica]TCK20892.1 glycosyltransferase involved in cell wall biosynthesis [Pseudonocardia endophytica]